MSDSNVVELSCEWPAATRHSRASEARVIVSSRLSSGVSVAELCHRHHVVDLYKYKVHKHISIAPLTPQVTSDAGH